MPDNDESTTQELVRRRASGSSGQDRTDEGWAKSFGWGLGQVTRAFVEGIDQLKKPFAEGKGVAPRRQKKKSLKLQKKQLQERLYKLSRQLSELVGRHDEDPQAGPLAGQQEFGLLLEQLYRSYLQYRRVLEYLAAREQKRAPPGRATGPQQPPADQPSPAQAEDLEHPAAPEQAAAEAEDPLANVVQLAHEHEPDLEPEPKLDLGQEQEQEQEPEPEPELDLDEEQAAEPAVDQQPETEGEEEESDDALDSLKEIMDLGAREARPTDEAEGEEEQS